MPYFPPDGDPIGGGGSSGGGGLGPPGGGGGGTSPPPSILPAPGEGMFIDLPPGLGSVDFGNGSQVIFDDIPGNLGTLYMDLNKFLLLVESRRKNATLNGVVPLNHRYRGHREAPKFNLMIQRLVTLCCKLFLTLRTSNTTLQTRETIDMYPTDTEIQEIYHVREQIEFKEWQLLKDSNKKWFAN